MDDHITNEVLDKVFFDDRSLRDIYVLNTDLGDWQRFFDRSNLSDWNSELYRDGQKAKYEKLKATELFEEKQNHNILLTIKFKDVFVNCYFFSEDEMEFDISPKDIKGLLEARAVFEFMGIFLDITGKEVILTPENTPDYPLATVKLDGSLHIRN